MWCGACQQDVPGVADAAANDATVRCARCGQALSRSNTQSGAGVPFEDLPEFIELEDWEFAETIQQAERIVHNIAADLKSTPDRHERWDLPHSPKRPASNRHVTAQRESGLGEHPKAASTTPWIVMSMGLAVFVCGAALIVLSLTSQRPQLWQLGLPMVLGGQVAVLAVVISQLDSVWNSNRATFVALHALDDQLRQLRDEWSQLQQLNDEQPFYRHLAEGASPDVLLSDLKDQIDILSEHLSRTKRAA